ncbi:RHS repeat-associated core domain-containing protein [Streptomyces sp. NPDC058307]|uniref:RHS repeat-associated core domain-containing protein n=1 Tax=Streptomyces sp. NPDC058307 TaxID=3346439 RepID=UPI0036E347C3
MGEVLLLPHRRHRQRPRPGRRRGQAHPRYAYGLTGLPRGTTTEAVPQPYRYAGTYLDPTGLYKMGARYCDPQLGRFTQPDPSAQEKNPYLYAGGDFVNDSDPTVSSDRSHHIGGHGRRPGRRRSRQCHRWWCRHSRQLCAWRRRRTLRGGHVGRGSSRPAVLLHIRSRR